MTVSMNLHTQTGGFVVTELPEPDRIPVKAIREAVQNLAERAAQMREADLRARAADVAVGRARADAASAAEAAAADGGAIPSKKLVKAVRAAEDELEEARMEYRARETAAMKARGKLIEIITKHTPAWRDVAMSSLDSSILKLTTGAEMVRKANLEMQEALGVLGMLERIPVDNAPVLASFDKSAIYVSEAQANIGAAIAEAMDVLDSAKGSVKAGIQVEVPVPDETPDEIVIEADDE